MEIYIKPVKKMQMIQRKLVYLEDVAEIFAPIEYMEQLRHLPVLQISSNQEQSYLLSVLDLVRQITAVVPNATVSSVGEVDILVEYHPKPLNQSKLWLWSRILFVSAVLFCGAATTIMCFHSDAQIPMIFQNYYQIFYGKTEELPMILTIPYSIGLVVGILVFFNHFSKIALSQDPTPIEVEMTTYENETVVSTVEQLSRKKREQS